jgi:hypothetical protein
MGQYDGEVVEPLTRPGTLRVTPDSSAKVPADREYCFGLDHDPRRRNSHNKTPQGLKCMLCDVNPICQLVRIKRDPKFYESIGWKIDGDTLVAP